MIDGDGLSAAVDALTALDSFTFDLGYAVRSVNCACPVQPPN